MRKTTLLFAGVAFLAALSPASSDEGLWLFTHPPRQQLQEKYAFQLTDALLERLQKASVMVGRSGSGSFVSADGLVLTNHHVGLEWLQDRDETNPNLVRDGFCAHQRDKELRCVGLELRVAWSMQDVSARVQAAIKPDMTLAQASKAREAVLRAIEEESRLKTGLVSEAVSLNKGGRYQLYRYKKYTDVRLVFAPEERVATLVDACFFRAYEHGKPAKIAHHLGWSSAAPAIGDLVMVAGYPGDTDRASTSAHLEALYGAPYMLRFKMVSRLNNRLAEFVKANPDQKRHAVYEAAVLDCEVGRFLSELDSLEKILSRIRARENAEQALLVQKEPETAQRRRQALDRIAVSVQEGAEISQAYYFLESAAAFQTYLFDYARGLLRFADESAKPDGDRLLEYSGADRSDTKRYLLEAKTIVKEMEIVKLAESLDLWARYAGADAKLVAKVLDGKTPEERARALIEGTHLDQVEVRKALIHGGRKAIAESNDTMLVLARLIDARSREVRRQVEENLAEPCRQAYAVLTHAHEQIRGNAFYPDGAGTLRLSFGKVQMHGDAKATLSPTGIATLADTFRWLNEGTQLPRNWHAARDKLDDEAPILFGCSADVAPGNSGSPIVDRQGRLMGIVARGNAVLTMDYLDDEPSCGAIAARGILEVLDKVYRASELVKELGGNRAPSSALAPAPPPALPAYSFPPPSTSPYSNSSASPPTTTLPYSNPSASSSFNASSPKSFGPGNPPTDILCPPPSRTAVEVFRSIGAGNPETELLIPPPAFDPTRQHDSPDTPSPPSLVNPFPPPEALLSPGPKSPPTLAAEKALSLGKRHKELVPALIKALKDSDARVQEAAALALQNLGADAVPALIEALQAQHKTLRIAAAIILEKLGPEAQDAIPALIQSLADEDVEIRRQAARALAAVVRDSDRSPPSVPVMTDR